MATRKYGLTTAQWDLFTTMYRHCANTCRDDQLMEPPSPHWGAAPTRDVVRKSPLVYQRYFVWLGTDPLGYRDFHPTTWQTTGWQECSYEMLKSTGQFCVIRWALTPAGRNALRAEGRYQEQTAGRPSKISGPGAQQSTVWVAMTQGPEASIIGIYEHEMDARQNPDAVIWACAFYPTSPAAKRLERKS